MPLQATSGAASYDAFGGGVPAVPNYIEDVFSTYLIKPSADFTNYSINNGIDLSTKGGMTWFKARDAAQNNLVYDTARGSSSGNANALITNGTQAQQTTFFDYVTPNTNGFTVNYASGGGQLTNSGINYASWTFRKQPKFFDVVTYTGTGSTSTEITHNLGSAPGMVICKKINSTSDWAVWHRGSGGNTDVTGLQLNGTVAAQNNPAGYSTLFTSTTFRPQFVGSSNDNANNVGATYVAYLFAHNAGGFGLTGTDNVISCGSYTGNGLTAGPSINLGYEPQWIMIKRANNDTGDWKIFDIMRGIATGGTVNLLEPNTSDAEVANNDINVAATGFNVINSNIRINASGSDYIYIAIRRGPMKVPTSGTSVFSPVARSGTGSTSTVSNSITTDLIISMTRNTAGIDSGVWDRLRGITKYLATTGTAAESTSSDSVTALNNTSYVLGADTATDRINRSGYTYANWTFRRAPSFFDEVCYTGTGVARTISHNLGVAPELMIVKNRSIASDWRAYSASLGATQNLKPNTTDAATSSTLIWNDTAPTSSVFTVGTASGVNGSGNNMVAYLFATCAGVSKVGSYTGNGSSQTINCGFTAGVRFLMIKNTTLGGTDWQVWDTARGITSGNDPVLYLNSTSAELNYNFITNASTGFTLNDGDGQYNASGSTYIYLAIA